MISFRHANANFNKTVDLTSYDENESDVVFSLLMYQSEAQYTGRYKIKIQSYTKGTKWLIRNQNGTYDSGTGYWYGCSLSNTETINSIKFTSEYENIRITAQDFIDLGFDVETMDPELCAYSYYFEKIDDTWEAHETTLSLLNTNIFKLYSEENYSYPKIETTITGHNLVNDVYYTGYSTMTMTVKITNPGLFLTNSGAGPLYEYRALFTLNNIKKMLAFNPSTDYESNCLLSKTLTFNFTSLDEYYYLDIDDYNGHYNSDEETIPVFWYTYPSCVDSYAYRGGTGYNDVILNAYGIYAAEITETVTFKYRWRVNQGSWSNWITIQTVAPTTGDGSITETITINSPIANGDVDIQLSIDDTTNTGTYIIYTGGPAVFHWGKNDFKFTVPVYINTNETPITINGVGLDDYIRSIN